MPVFPCEERRALRGAEKDQVPWLMLSLTERGPQEQAAKRVTDTGKWLTDPVEVGADAVPDRIKRLEGGDYPVEIGSCPWRRRERASPPKERGVRAMPWTNRTFRAPYLGVVTRRGSRGSMGFPGSSRC